MSKLEVPELDWKERVTRDVILKLLPNNLSDYDDLHDEDVKAAKSILAQEYVEHGHINGILKIGIILLFYDIMFLFPTFAYGLAISAYGSLLLAMPALHTPGSLTSEVVERSRDLQQSIRLNAERSVKTNIGVVGLTIGFTVQIFAAVNALPGEIVPWNYFQGDIGNGVAFVTVLLISDIVLNRLSKSRYQEIASTLFTKI
ncbi:hypothetical protein [Halovivax asiaticus]|uniref:hypothetical protein n=1 Tax=Halovivax asiaticus TaxID=332953 RepID=UPI0012676B80|nr:hypothetical protein [Halovivax asiaticus]